MKYLFNDIICFDWKNDAEFYCLDIIDEEQYQKFKYCKEKLTEIIDVIDIGNQEYDINFLEYDYIEISDYEAGVIQKYAKGYQTIFDLMINCLNRHLQCKDISCEKLSVNDFKKAIDDYIERNKTNAINWY